MDSRAIIVYIFNNNMYIRDNSFSYFQKILFINGKNFKTTL